MPLHCCYLSWLQGGLEGVLLSKMCTALKEPILIEWGPFRINLQRAHLEPLASVVANALLLRVCSWPGVALGCALQCRMLTSKRQNLCHE
jgi:hypothetical protein